MKNLFIFASIMATMSTHAQEAESWKIKWNGEKILVSDTEDKKANVRKVSMVSSSSDSLLEIKYNDNSKEGIKRSFLIFGASDNELLRLDSTWSAKVSRETLEKVMGTAKKIEIYTIALPTDPELAARVRVRRVHLCTLLFQ